MCIVDQAVYITVIISIIPTIHIGHAPVVGITEGRDQKTNKLSETLLGKDFLPSNLLTLSQCKQQLFCAGEVLGEIPSNNGDHPYYSVVTLIDSEKPK